jgi:hypothetical protein
MLVPVFAMYYRSRRIISAYNRNLATIQAQRRAEAHRIMQLAEESPEKLTRAERAAVEGKIAWRESVASWQAVRKEREGSVGSGSWSASGSGEVPSPSRGSTSTSSQDLRRDLEMGSPMSWPMPPPGRGEEAVIPAAATLTPMPRTVPAGLSDLGLEQAELQCNSRVELIALHDLASKHRLDPAVLKDIELLLTGNGHPQRPTTSIDGNVQTASTATVTVAPLVSPATRKTTPTMLYGFHLPRPQAVQAYTLTEKHKLADDKRLPPKDDNSSARQMPEDPTLSTFVPATSSPKHLAVHSPSSPTRTSGDVPVPTVKPHVLQPLRRSATIRRASSASIETSRTRPVVKRSKSGTIRLLPSPSSDDFQHPDGDEAGPKWHRERMKKLHSSIDLSDLKTKERLDNGGKSHK